MKVSEGLWLMNKAALLQLEHFNKSNALSWALTMGLFAMPVVYSDSEWNQMVGESYLHPTRHRRPVRVDGAGGQGLSDSGGQPGPVKGRNLPRLLSDEPGRRRRARATCGISGLSKQRDFGVTQEVLRAYGDAVKDAMKQVLRAIAEARQDGVSIDVSGMDEFDIGDFSNELDDAKKLLDLGIESETLKKQIFKKLAFKYLCDARQEIKNRVAEEIERAGARGTRTNADQARRRRAGE